MNSVRLACYNVKHKNRFLSVEWAEYVVKGMKSISFIYITAHLEVQAMFTSHDQTSHSVDTATVLPLFV